MGRVERQFWRHKGQSRILKNKIAQFISVALKCKYCVACGVVKRQLKILVSSPRIYVAEPFQMYSTVAGFLSEFQMTGTGVMQILSKNPKFSLGNLPVCCLFSSLLNLGLKIDLLILFSLSCRSLLWVCFLFFIYPTVHLEFQKKKDKNENQMWLVKKHLQPFQFSCVL